LEQEIGCTTPTTNLAAPTKNLPHIRDKNMVITRELRIDSVTKLIHENDSEAMGRESASSEWWVISELHLLWSREERGVYRVLLGKPGGRRPLGRPRRRWVDNIRMDLQEVGCGCMDWIGLAQDRDRWRTLVSAVMNLRVP